MGLHKQSVLWHLVKAHWVVRNADLWRRQRREGGGGVKNLVAVGPVSGACRPIEFCHQDEERSVTHGNARPRCAIGSGRES